MRQAGVIADETQARQFADYLLGQGIRNRVEPAADGWAVWVLEESDAARSRQELAQYLAAPADPRYAAASQAAAEVRRAEAARQREFQRNYVEMRERWDAPRRGRAVVTYVLMVASIAVSVATRFGQELEPLGVQLFISAQIQPERDARGRLVWPLARLDEVRAGQVWRLVTPIFLHFRVGGIPFLHLLFNMLWLYSLGTAIEARRGSWRLAALVLLIAVVSNLSQYLVAGPVFGGMSGVVYGLFGFVWIRSRFAREQGLYMDPNTVMLMLGWFLLCLTGAVGPVANAAHGMGLLTGAIAGVLPVLRRRWRW